MAKPSLPSSTKAASALECRLAVLGADARLTPHRREVFQVLAQSTDHPTAYDVFDRVKSRSAGISLATVYNCLEHLSSHGLIRKVQLDQAQCRFCANLHEHVHFHCTQCDQVIDALPTTPMHAGDFWQLPEGARVNRTDVAIHGLCPRCAEKRNRT
ncbi:MAG: transcriptional repressor [Verrucomicrobiales bacterium]|nr:transcriptional repressor [Verrucomicrobiales bacterium]